MKVWGPVAEEYHRLHRSALWTWQKVEDPRHQHALNCKLAHWLAYLDSEGYRQAASMFRDAARGGRPITLPTDSPFNFDLGYNIGGDPWTQWPDEQWFGLKEPSSLSYEERKALGDQARASMREFQRKQATMYGERRRPNSLTIDEAKAALERIDPTLPPPQMSDELQRKMGVRPNMDMVPDRYNEGDTP